MFLFSCEDEKFFCDNFSKKGDRIKECNVNFDLNRHCGIDDMFCDDSNLIVMNSGTDYLYTLYDVANGEQMKMFGRIGNGHGEIPIGCVSWFQNDSLSSYNLSTNIIYKFPIVGKKTSSIAMSETKCNIENGIISDIVAIDTNRYFALGTYLDKYHYFLLDKNGCALDSAIEIYNCNDGRFNKFCKFLSNQGEITLKPNGNRVAGITFMSGLIDFMMIKDDRIDVIKSYNNIIPDYNIDDKINLSKVIPTEKSITGFLGISGNMKYVFALYSEERWFDLEYKSKDILVFDWDGNPIKHIQTDNYIICMSVNETKMFTLEEDDNGEQHIKTYIIDF